MKEKWIQLINTIEKDPFETEAFFALMEYVDEVVRRKEGKTAASKK